MFPQTDVTSLMMKGETGDSGDEEELLQEVLKRAEKAGQEVSKRQLKRWRDEGLIPSPRKTGLGQGVGTDAFYPSGTGELVAAIARELEQERNLRNAAFKLWFRGYPLTSYVREWFLSQLRSHDRRARAAHRAYESGLTEKAVTEWVDRDRLPYLGQVRRKVGRAEFFHPVRYGLLASVGETSAEELRADLGLTDDSLPFDWYEERSEALRTGVSEVLHRKGWEKTAQLLRTEEEVEREELVDGLADYAEYGRPGAAYETARQRPPEEWEELRDQAVEFVEQWLPDADDPGGYAFLVFKWLVIFPDHRKNPVEYLREELQLDRPVPTDTVEEFVLIALGEGDLE